MKGWQFCFLKMVLVGKSKFTQFKAIFVVTSKLCFRMKDLVLTTRITLFFCNWYSKSNMSSIHQ